MTTTDRTHRVQHTDGTDRTHHPVEHRTEHRSDGADHPGSGRDDTRLLPPAEREEFLRRMHQAVNGFVDEPRRSVEEADALFEELSRRISALVAERHHGLRAPWRDDEAATETEDLRNALRRYRDAAERLTRL
ncbi:hypothetical protein CUT44_29835 [Streptomyces carminius]|uniref:Uncharacterized protein n=1 Tax=Streptomyces carminius TaxID=2665496 RepID=A0A2M8LR44_9ACTN|nr:hypothetical protein [Streptomyces carminius]PJE94433.1 hypothetical protein CUT44_29835 [Streptomyces carminius]